MILPVVCFVLGAAASLLAIRYFTHMFQLNAYKPKVQLKWLWHNSPRLWVRYCCWFWRFTAGVSL